MTNENKKTSLVVRKDDLKWLKKRKIESDHNTLAQTFHEVIENAKGEQENE